MRGASEKSADQILTTPVQFLKGVGPQRAELLLRLGLATARDVLFFFPRDYRDISRQCAIGQLQEGELASVRGTVEEIDLQGTGTGRSVLGVLLRQENQYLRAIWFNQPQMHKRFFQGQQVLVSGKARLQGMRWEMTHPQVEYLEAEEEEPSGSMLPVYPLTEGLRQEQMRRIVRNVLELAAPMLDEVFPATYLQEHDLWPIHKAIEQIHAPTDKESLARAQRRFIYQELLVLQLALALRRQRLTSDCRATPLPISAKIDAHIRRLFPFEFTADQNRAVAEIAADMALSCPMNRLLQGDVGSGKTAVAQYAILLAVAHRHQAALMAPTEILARQHALTLQQALSGSQVRIGLLTGALGAAQRRQMLDQLAAGELDIVVGTQAIVQSEVRFARLGLVVIDEQHKFGVRQRATLRQAGLNPHYLVMTATPIPRTLAMTLFGDLETSTLRESPPGRQSVHTYLGNDQQRAKWRDFFREKLRQGRQGYVVTPRVEQSETLAASSLQEAFEQLANGELEAFRLDLIHGSMSPAEKAAAMDSFRSGQTQVLVATSVVEVGIDVPNATVMTIEGGEVFGLAQLHQLRGRISRGAHPGYVCVFANPPSPDAGRRLEAFAETTDGFQLAETDFQLRGPGELLGTRQHGLPPLRIADMVRDADVLEEARRDAQALIKADPGLQLPSHARLQRMLLIRYGQALDLSDVG